jgi:D-arabinose 1-dehydrogenase-like Zn-dependent alcohol dehydrogenase
MNEMLHFCSVHNIRPQTETMPMEKINEAFERVRRNEQRYRIVLKW